VIELDTTYRLVDGRIETTNAAAGPWDPELQHGAAPAALLTWAAERIESSTPTRVARMTIDLIRPVPIAPLELHTHITREGRKILTASIRLFADEREVARASVLKIRLGEESDDAGPPLDLPGPEAASPLAGPSPTPCAFLDGISMRVARGVGLVGGPAAIWFRVDRPVIEHETTSALMRAAVCADFCNGASAVLDPRKWSFINADISLNLARTPVGEWILLDARTWPGQCGSALAFARLADTNGWFGRASQSLIIERRGAST
jgi:Acyl-CoA thioesterase C-terminal domain/Acyl-CoA thioesterase N-terminal domain